MAGLKSALELLRRAAAKPPRVIAVRGAQAAGLALTHYTGGWARIDATANARWTPERAAELTELRPHVVFAPGAVEALEDAVRAGTVSRERIVETADRIAARDFAILSVPVPKAGSWPWNSDWHHGHDWPLGPQLHPDHYADRDVSYDVKYPWELGRLQFLLPLLQGAVLAPEAGYMETAFAILDDWRAANPYAGSVNWYPMEASMRTLALVMALELARVAGADSARQAALLADIERNAVFVWKTIEDTDIRGNHYTANLAALMAAGAALAPLHRPARRWLAYARGRMSREIRLQFTRDGVNFEKSVYYHRLVTDLFLMMTAIAHRLDTPPDAEAEVRLREACRCIGLFMRPDGTWPVVGDSDDAVVFPMDWRPAHDHRDSLAVGGALFDDAALRRAGGRSLAALWLCGGSGEASSTAEPAGALLAEGGFAVIREDGAHLLADVGEVGLAGRGGHGHNDILGFELSLGGVPLLVDAGSYMYTGDLAARERFRGTAAHNGLMVDGEEIARLGPGPFRIHPDAVPLEPSLRREGAEWILEGGHAGYARLDDPVLCRRVWWFSPAASVLVVEDTIEAKCAHETDRRLHFPPGATLAVDRDSATVDVAGLHAVVIWNEGARAAPEIFDVSRAYGEKAPAPVLRLSDTVHGGGRLRFRIHAAPQRCRT